MFDFNKPNIEITEISDDKRYGRFVVEPLERGYGTHLEILSEGSCFLHFLVLQSARLRLMELLHEFSSIPGVKEDVTEIVMNLKSLGDQEHIRN